MISCLVSLLVTVILIDVHRCEVLQLNIDGSEYQYLPPHQSVFRFKVTRRVTFDRKVYNDVWIYRNGFVIVGEPLEEELYPNMTSGGRTSYQPFENLSGSNIIAVFLTLNRNISNSKVRVREISINSKKSRSNSVVRSMKTMVSRSYGQALSYPIETIVAIEWIDMEVEGDRNKKNSFELFILSNVEQSFAIFQYSKIEVVSYQLGQNTLKYQSGLQSYANRHYTIPFYNIQNKDVPLTQSSNIGIKNTWLLGIGDSAYNFDLGQPKSLQNTFSPQTSRPPYADIKILPEGISPTMEASTNGKFSTKTIHQDDITKSPNPSESSTISYEPQKTYYSTSERTEQPTLLSRISTTEEYRSLKTRNVKKTSKRSTVSFTKDQFITSPEHSTKGQYMSVQHATFSSGRVNALRNISESKDKSKILKKTFPSRSVTSARPKNEEPVQTFLERSIDTKNVPLQEESNCHKNGCSDNEECYNLNGYSCCRCPSEMVHIGSTCAKIGTTYRIPAYGSVLIPHDGRLITLDISAAVSVRNNLSKTLIILQSSQKIDLALRNFILLLNPVFKIPMAFYAHSWKKQHVPNLSSLARNVTAMSIWIRIEGFGELYVTFKLNRTTDDMWTIAIQSLDMKRVKALDLDGLRLDEKTASPSTLKYTLNHKNSVDFNEQLVTFSDESMNRVINVTWRGSMTFPETCLSNYIGSRSYFVKFPDTDYCNSDCPGGATCRVMCIGSPHVFEAFPGPCEGVYCPNQMVCIEGPNRYDCKCPDGLQEIGDRCVGPTRSSEAPTTTLEIVPRSSCNHCSKIASCQILNRASCCFCESSFVGSGIQCYRREGEYEFKFSGVLNAGPRGEYEALDIPFNVMYRQWLNRDVFEQATFMEFGNVTNPKYQPGKLASLVFILSPIFDVPMSLFASDSSKDLSSSIYSLSKGSLQLFVHIDGISSSRISVAFNISETISSSDIKITVLDLPLDISSSLINKYVDIFKSRKVPDITYRIKGRQIILEPYEVNPFGSSRIQSMRVSGQGEMDLCSDQGDNEKMLTVTTTRPIRGINCEGRSCRPYQQSKSDIKRGAIKKECIPSCNQNAKCIDEICVCLPGFSGDGVVCRQIRKDLECSSTDDCKSDPTLACLNGICSCKLGTIMRDNQCSVIDPCQSCGRNEHCVEGQCACRPQFLRNRVSQQCIFDCSQCDIYSTICSLDNCICKDRYVFESDSNVTCTLKCLTDSDCPTDEFCRDQDKCICPSRRFGGLCSPLPTTTFRTSECSYCSKNAICKNDQCKCLPDWNGNGISCQYNCSLCFHPLYCSPDTGCSCPPDYVGNGKDCLENRCNNCPENSSCEKMAREYRCQCIHGMVMVNDRCVKEPIRIDIVPSGPISVRDGDQVELVCIGNSKLNSFQLEWTRRSGKRINGLQSYIDKLNTTIKLLINRITSEDSDDYICRASSGEFSSKTVFADVNTCGTACHRFASCVSGKCKCLPTYSGNGMDCVKTPECPIVCPDNMFCDKSRGKCQCRPGYREHKSRCNIDCTVNNVCGRNSICDSVTGQCKCSPGFMGKGDKCWKERTSCLLTKNCGTNASCISVEKMQQYICVCDPGFLGNGSSCHRRVDCNLNPCGPHSFCEPSMVQDHLDNMHMNGKCSCDPGYSFVGGICQDPRLLNKVMWMSMGEAIISFDLIENRSAIRYIDTNPYDKESNGGIIALTGDCTRRKLYWSAEKGSVIRWAMIEDKFNATTLLYGLGKVNGLTVDDLTGNVFFTDRFNGRIAVLDPAKNFTKTLIRQNDFVPGQIIAHSQSGKLFWIVNDLLNSRIETSSMDGTQRRVFVHLTYWPISLTIVPGRDEDDELCWVEVIRKQNNQNHITNKPSIGFLNCAGIKKQNQPPSVRLVHTILSEEPSAALSFSDNFYWGVRTGKYLRVLDQNTTSKIPIIKNCCDIGVRGLIVLREICQTRDTFDNPCISSKKPKCAEICVQTLNPSGKISPTCLEANDL